MVKARGWRVVANMAAVGRAAAPGAAAGLERREGTATGWKAMAVKAGQLVTAKLVAEGLGKADATAGGWRVAAETVGPQVQAKLAAASWAGGCKVVVQLVGWAGTEV